jgi:rhamnose utilization protein RhaD (predicted bifunctional aldolase and dehydrogenase)
MESLWNDSEAQKYGNDPLRLRAYTSRLLGSEPSLVLHGGGNTSVKAMSFNIFGDEEEVLYVKGSGWDLAAIEAPGFAPVRLKTLQRMAALEQLSDTDMVKAQRAAMLDPTAPNPSVEAILHAIIPFRYVDHTHADAVVTLTNTPDGQKHIRQIYGERILVIPYVMPGFVLARKVFEMTRGMDWTNLEGMILMHHGVFSFADDAKTSYERMIYLVTEAEKYLENQKACNAVVTFSPQSPLPLEKLARLRKAVSVAQQQALVVLLTDSETACGFSSRANVESLATRGPLTPDHVIRTKRIPLIVDEEQIEKSVTDYVQAYHAYFKYHNKGNLTCLAPAPRWAVWPSQGTLAFGRTVKEAKIIEDITCHTIKAIQWAEALGGWEVLDEADIFEVEYWELEQAKLRKGGIALPFQGKVALVSGAASGIGKTCAQALLEQGACVMALDINPEIESMFNSPQARGRVCDITHQQEVR